MTGSVRTWIPAAVLALVLTGLLAAGAYFGLRQTKTATTPSPTPSLDIHSEMAVTAAVHHYYDVEAEARRSGNSDLVDGATIGHDSVASYNFRLFMQEQAKKGRRSVVLESHFDNWSVTLDGDRATANYVIWLRGHDTDATSGNPVEPDQDTSKGSYRMDLLLQAGVWRVVQRQLLQDNVP